MGDRIVVLSERPGTIKKIIDIDFGSLSPLERRNAPEFQEYFHVSVEKIYGRVIEKYIRQGLLEKRNGRIFLTRRGIHVSNAVMADFLL